MPRSLEPVYAFVNSLDAELGTDDWRAGPGALSAWLLDKGLVGKPTRASRAEYQLALELRAGLRELALQNNGHEPDTDVLGGLQKAMRHFPLTVRPAADPVEMFVAAGATPVMAGFARVVAGYAVAVATGEWVRLRRCPMDDCAWVFWDSSAKGARRWCTMRVCGN